MQDQQHEQDVWIITIWMTPAINQKCRACVKEKKGAAFSHEQKNTYMQRRNKEELSCQMSKVEIQREFKVIRINQSSREN